MGKDGIITDREQYVIDMRENGATYKEIGKKIGVSDTQAKAIYQHAIWKRKDVDSNALSAYIFNNVDDRVIATRIRNNLIRNNIKTIEEFKAVSDEEYRQMRNVGNETLEYIKELKRKLRAENNELTFDDIKADIDIAVDETQGCNDSMFTILYGKRFWGNADALEKTVQVSVYKDTDGETFVAEVVDHGKLLGENFVPTKEFFLSCYEDVLKLCNFHPVDNG